ncbi:type I phosphomannose isomerase catalytic subunit [Mesoplasma florum]|uniref:type I phosphomannose isomerase catalytic subunit n=1 Tax=Mesoplasma florum TaxID=2151 RepID=UPI000D0452B8|nr:type I phosphomannose isomerase catalytic subunit [Mesoplasma florum]AVN58932.1 mannose-6-phosphate isomerase [Mesoplasma florum]
MKVLQIEPYQSEKIWGTKYWESFNYGITDKKIGEIWLISAHENGMTTIPEFNISLKQYFDENRQLFGNYKGDFPLLSKIIKANDFLSVQVHPDDVYALEKHNQFGKPESWLILDCPNNAEIIYGHNAKNKNDFLDSIKSNDWKNILNKVKVNKGDFIYVPPGKIHAITPNITVLEIQRSSDITYRLYDYDRLENDKKRELHIEDSLNNISFPDSDDFILRQVNENFFSSKYFSISLKKVTDKGEFILNEKCYWLQATVISGKGKVENTKLKKGDSIIILEPNKKINLYGDLEIVFYWLKK